MDENEKTREFRIAEVNRMLPMVRETRKRNEEIERLREKIHKLDEFLSNTEKNLTQIKEVSKSLDKILEQDFIQNVLSPELDLVQEKLENQLKASHELREQYAKEKDLLCELVSTQETFYKAVICAIFSEEGFLKEEEIQKEFLGEYVLLLRYEISYLWEKCPNEKSMRHQRKNLFNIEALEAFKQLLANENEVQKNYANEIRAVLEFY